MNVAVVGLWHLGSVTAACVASAGHRVTAIDFDATTVANLRKGVPPVFEPGLEERVRAGLAQGTLSFSDDPAAVAGQAVVWITYDTPVDQQDRADVDFVINQVRRLFPHLDAGTQVLISSQLPVGSVRTLEADYARDYPTKPVQFACSPENLRLGKALEVFTKPDRVVVGVRAAADRARISELFAPFTDRMEWMSVESAEMTKHALNAFLATSVVFANEIAVLCERVGADAKEVERGLKSEARIGPRAYLGPGGAFAGGTLARDICFLEQLGRQNARATTMLSAVRKSNNHHKHWCDQQIREGLGEALHGKTIAILGLAYKPGTDTLRRSSAVELCRRLLAAGATVRAHDPQVNRLPANLASKMTLCNTLAETLHGAVALVLATPWPEYHELTAETIVAGMTSPLVIDPNRFLAQNFTKNARIRYVAVGKAAT